MFISTFFGQINVQLFISQSRVELQRYKKKRKKKELLLFTQKTGRSDYKSARKAARVNVLNIVNGEDNPEVRMFVYVC